MRDEIAVEEGCWFLRDGGRNGSIERRKVAAGKEDPDQRIDEILDERVHNRGRCSSDNESDCEADDPERLEKIHEFFNEAFLLLGSFLHLVQSRKPV